MHAFKLNGDVELLLRPLMTSAGTVWAGQSRQRRPLRNFGGLFLLFSSLSRASDPDDAI
jgi:hypothetical protein